MSKLYSHIKGAWNAIGKPISSELQAVVKLDIVLAKYVTSTKY